MKPTNAPIPPKLALRPKDRRGYPIPFIVMRDDDGRPHFTINNHERVEQAIRQRICAMCGKKLEFDCWLIGGPGAAFHQHGAFLDPPVHHACGTYALQVCPFLAAPSYSHRIDGSTLDLAKVKGMALVQEDGMQPDQPPFFAFARTSSIERYSQQTGIIYVIPKRPWKAVEFWNNGERITSEDAERLFVSSETQSAQLDELIYWSREDHNVAQLGHRTD